MKLQITIEVDGPICLNDATECLQKAIRQYKRDRVLCLEDKPVSLNIPYTPANAACSIRWEVYK